MENDSRNIEERRKQFQKIMLRESRSSHFVRAAMVGFLVGTVAVLFQLAIAYAEELRVGLANYLGSNGGLGFAATILFCGSVTGTAGFLTYRYCPEATGSGIPHVKAVLLNLRELRWVRLAITKFTAGFLAIAGGLSMGREGPTVHMGAAIGKGLAERLKIPRRSYRTLIAAGAGAGLSAAFNAPLAGFLFVLEELQRELTPTTYGTALIASVCADAVTRLCMGQHSAFHIQAYDAPSMSILPLILMLGALIGLMGVAFNKALMKGSQWMSRFGWWKTIVVGAIAGVLLWCLPEITGGGHGTAELVLKGSFDRAEAYWLLVLLIVGKMAFTVICYGASVPGGIFAPILVAGAFTGLLTGELLQQALPGVPINSAAFAVLGMAALFSASVRAPLTGIVLIVEMTGNYEQLYALISASLMAYLVAEAFRSEPIYESLLKRDLMYPDPAEKTDRGPGLMEVHVEVGSYLADKQAGDLGLPDGVMLLSILREHKEIVPPAHMHIRSGDVLVFLLESHDPASSYMVSTLAKA